MRAAPAEMIQEARRLARESRIPEAIAAYRRILGQWPDRADSWYNLGLLERRARQFDAALASYRHALDLGIARPEEVHLNRAVIYSDDLKDSEAAERELRLALEKNPDYVPARLNLGNLFEDLGRRDAARETYERLLEQDPACREALARTASLHRFSDAADPLIGRLKRELASAAPSPAERASLAFALGRALDECGAYADAFESYRGANEWSRASAPGGTARYDRAATERLIDRLIGAFPAPGTPPARATAPPRPVFVCGMFRSGSTLIEQLLAGHPRIDAGGELDLIPRLAEQSLRPFPESIAALAPARLAELASAYRGALAALFPAGELVTDKRPDNFLYIGLIKLLFPDARIVHTVRDPLDNCLSIFFLHLDQRMSYALDLMDIGHYYVQYRRLMAHWKSLYAGAIHDVSYDALVREPRGTLQRLVEFLGLEWHEGCLELAPSGRAVKTASVWQVREPLYQRSSGRSRHYAPALRELTAYLSAAAILG